MYMVDITSTFKTSQVENIWKIKQKPKAIL